jgi:hypothetical protein
MCQRKKRYLTSEDVIRIFKSKESNKNLADEYDLDPKYIASIKRGDERQTVLVMAGLIKSKQRKKILWRGPVIPNGFIGNMELFKSVDKTLYRSNLGWKVKQLGYTYVSEAYAKMIIEKMTIKDIAKELSVTQGTVRDVCKKLCIGYWVYNRGGEKPETPKKDPGLDVIGVRKCLFCGNDIPKIRDRHRQSHYCSDHEYCKNKTQDINHGVNMTNFQP